MKIGIFDSGIGGITVLSEVIKKFPEAELLYLCDNKYLPYGNKTVEFIKKRLKEILDYFYAQKCCVVFIACHSASSVYVKNQEDFSYDSMKIIDTIQPTCNYLNMFPGTAVGIMATDRTIQDRTYSDILKSHDVLNFPSGNLATMIEMQHSTDPDTNEERDCSTTVSFLKNILEESRLKLLSKIVLACTHYPHVIDSIRDWVTMHSEECEVIDPANIVVSKVSLSDFIDGESSNFDNTRDDDIICGYKLTFLTTGESESLKRFCKNSKTVKHIIPNDYIVKHIDL